MNKAKNMTTGAGYLLRREDYKRVKKITEVQKAISETPGIGAKRLEAIMESLNSKFAKEEDA